MEHHWFVHPSFKPLVTCKHCGMVRGSFGQNKPCLGKVRVELRENRLRQSTPSGADAAGRIPGDAEGE